MIGNALGDGKPKDNTTDPKSETFAEKYRRELKKDMDDLGADEEGDIDFDLNDDDLLPEDLEDGGDMIDLDALMGDDDEDEEGNKEGNIDLDALLGEDEEEHQEQ